ncbi:MAG: sigma-54 dependent transcriptional regulator [Candidatus Acidiferrales bacterium]
MSDLLIVDDELPMRTALEASFRQCGWLVASAGGVAEAIAVFRNDPCGLVLTDMKMGDGDGLQLMQGIRQIAPQTPVVFLTAYGNVNEAVVAIKEGACDYLIKPVSFDHLKQAVQTILDRNSCEQFKHHEFIGSSGNFRALLANARRVAQTDADVLVEAESGTGKELLARMIHRFSPRANKPYVAVNCSAFPESLLESELFGHVRGAFTGATASKAGKFLLADGGTLLLDEIGEMPLSLQPKLLRVLQEREIDRLGDTHPVHIDVRVIATTNRSLTELIDRGMFRSDLYYRLNVVPLTIPPLRERRSDIPELAEYFLRKYEPRAQRGQFFISPELSDVLCSYDWPGNIRELENAIRRALALAGGTTLGVGAVDPSWGSKFSSKITAPKPGQSLQAVERKLLEATLHATGGNRTRTAEMMGVSLRTIRNKIREYGLAAREAV